MPLWDKRRVVNTMMKRIFGFEAHPQKEFMFNFLRYQANKCNTQRAFLNLFPIAIGGNGTSDHLKGKVGYVLLRKLILLKG